jgi:hypothetical protein
MRCARSAMSSLLRDPPWSSTFLRVESLAVPSTSTSPAGTAALPTGGDADQSGQGRAHQAQRAGLGHHVGDQFERDVADRSRVARRVAADPVQRDDLVEQSELRRVELSQQPVELTAGRQESERVEAGEREAVAGKGVGAGQVVGRGGGRVGDGEVGGFRRREPADQRAEVKLVSRAVWVNVPSPPVLRNALCA